MFGPLALLSGVQRQVTIAFCGSEGGRLVPGRSYSQQFRQLDVLSSVRSQQGTEPDVRCFAVEHQGGCIRAILQTRPQRTLYALANSNRSAPPSVSKARNLSSDSFALWDSCGRSCGGKKRNAAQRRRSSYTLAGASARSARQLKEASSEEENHAPRGSAALPHSIQLRVLHLPTEVPSKAHQTSL